ncbi:hypothetical protein AAP_04845 [Ascosphaera apis ARSEF 7405]|uniref:Uncharacterized protein n=1 Tax=Ascosphaera apis ARSEF 7405 TaxID=392613 RepID=A0A167WEK1_9EURO|nr:hypothetical protein AAP_04845 [Ascosphaera apis ARSEF 7405]
MSSAVEAYRAAFIEQQVKDEQLFATGEYSRFIFPRHFIAFIIMWAALLIKYPSPRASKYGRMFAYVLVCYFSVYNILYVRTTGCGHGYGAGLVGIWAMLWGSNLLVFNDPERDFKRIEYRRVLVIEERTLPPIGRDGRIPGVKFKRKIGVIADGGSWIYALVFEALDGIIVHLPSLDHQRMSSRISRQRRKMDISRFKIDRSTTGNASVRS